VKLVVARGAEMDKMPNDAGSRHVVAFSMTTLASGVHDDTRYGPFPRRLALSWP
jgi:hypothetical protein